MVHERASILDDSSDQNAPQSLSSPPSATAVEPSSGVQASEKTTDFLSATRSAAAPPPAATTMPGAFVAHTESPNYLRKGRANRKKDEQGHDDNAAIAAGKPAPTTTPGAHSAFTESPGYLRKGRANAKKGDEDDTSTIIAPLPLTSPGAFVAHNEAPAYLRKGRANKKMNEGTSTNIPAVPLTTPGTVRVTESTSPRTTQRKERAEKKKEAYSIPSQPEDILSHRASRENRDRAFSDDEVVLSSEVEEDLDETTELTPGAHSISPMIEATQSHADSTRSFLKNNIKPAESDRMLLVADLAPEIIDAEEVNVQEEEAITTQREKNRQVFTSAIVFYSLAIIGQIAGFVICFKDRPMLYQTYGDILVSFWGWGSAAVFHFTATLLMFLPSWPRVSPIRLEAYAPDDKRLLQQAQIVSTASFCIIFPPATLLAAIAERYYMWGYALMTWFLAGTLFALFRGIRLLRNSPKAERKGKSKIFWSVFVLFFLTLFGISVWRLAPQYPDCVVKSPELIGTLGDGWCDGCFFLNETYIWDPNEEFSCNDAGEDYNTEECGFEFGDCDDFRKKYPDCRVAFPYWIGDEACDGPWYNTEECGHDGGDCQNVSSIPAGCNVEFPEALGDGYCDGGAYGSEACGYDKGDCIRSGDPCHYGPECASKVCDKTTRVCAGMNEKYPNCTVTNIEWLGDGACDYGEYASEDCGFDGGDCLLAGASCLQDFDCLSGRCNVETALCDKAVIDDFPCCYVDSPWRLGDDVCDGYPYSWPECGYDGGDCKKPGEACSQNEECASESCESGLCKEFGF